MRTTSKALAVLDEAELEVLHDSLNEDLRCWHRGYEIEFGAAATQTDIDSRPRIASLFRRSTEVKEMLERKLRMKEQQAENGAVAEAEQRRTKKKKSTKKRRKKLKRSASSPFDVGSLSARYGSSSCSSSQVPSLLARSSSSSMLYHDDSALADVMSEAISLPSDSYVTLEQMEEEQRQLEYEQAIAAAAEEEAQQQQDELEQVAGVDAGAPVQPLVVHDDNFTVIAPGGGKKKRLKPMFVSEARLQALEEKQKEMPIVAMPVEPPLSRRATHDPEPKRKKTRFKGSNKNYHRMKLKGQGRVVRRHGGGFTNVSSSFIRHSTGYSNGDENDVAEAENPFKPDGSHLLQEVELRFNPGLQVEERQAFEQLAQSEAVQAVDSRDVPLVIDGPIDEGWLLDTLRDNFGFSEFREGQRQVIERMLTGGNSVALLPTGGGKSLCYQFPTLAFPGTLTLVISPLISLMQDQLAKLPVCLRGECLSSQKTPTEMQRILEKAQSGAIDVLFIAPERLVQETFHSILPTLPRVRLVCIDECHCISQYGHNFRTSYLQLEQVIHDIVKPQVVLGLTATATQLTLSSILPALRIDDPVDGVIRAPVVRPNLKLNVALSGDPHREFLTLLKSDPYRSYWDESLKSPMLGSVILYAMRQKDAERVAETCKLHGIPAESYHAGLSKKQRDDVQNNFEVKKTRIVVATVAFGMGIDVPDVRAVIHFNLPKSLESYVQEVGRAGRDGQESHCHLFLIPDDYVKLRSLAFSEGLDTYAVKQLVLQWILKRSTAAGVDACVSMDEAERAVDVKKEVISTILCWLHLGGYIEIMPQSYQFCLLGFHSSSPEELAEKDPFIAFALKNSKASSAGKYRVNLQQAALHLGCDVAVIQKQLFSLRKTSGIKYKLQDRAFFFRPSEKLLELKSDAKGCIELVTSLHSKLNEVENSNVEKLRVIYNEMSMAINAQNANDYLKSALDRYFSVHQLSELEQHWSRDATQGLEESQCDSYIRGDVLTMIRNTGDALTTGRQIARILKGISSPNFPAHQWGSNTFWGRYRNHEFASLISLGDQCIQANWK